MSTVETITQSLPALSLHNKNAEGDAKEEYRYTHLLPVFPKDEHYPPLTPFEHVDPGFRALSRPNPRAFLDNATSLTDLTPRLGTEVRGVNLVELDSDGRDQLALEVRVSFRDARAARVPSPAVLLHCPPLTAHDTIGRAATTCNVGRLRTPPPARVSPRLIRMCART